MTTKFKCLDTFILFFFIASAQCITDIRSLSISLEKSGINEQANAEHLYKTNFSDDGFNDHSYPRNHKSWCDEKKKKKDKEEFISRDVKFAYEFVSRPSSNTSTAMIQFEKVVHIDMVSSLMTDCKSILNSWTQKGSNRRLNHFEQGIIPTMIETFGVDELFSQTMCVSNNDIQAECTIFKGQLSFYFLPSKKKDNSYLEKISETVLFAETSIESKMTNDLYTDALNEARMSESDYDIYQILWKNISSLSDLPESGDDADSSYDLTEDMSLISSEQFPASNTTSEERYVDDTNITLHDSKEDEDIDKISASNSFSQNSESKPLPSDNTVEPNMFNDNSHTDEDSSSDIITNSFDPIDLLSNETDDVVSQSDDALIIRFTETLGNSSIFTATCSDIHQSERIDEMEHFEIITYSYSIESSQDLIEMHDNDEELRRRERLIQQVEREIYESQLSKWLQCINSDNESRHTFRGLQDDENLLVPNEIVSSPLDSVSDIHCQENSTTKAGKECFVVDGGFSFYLSNRNENDDLIRQLEKIWIDSVALIENRMADGSYLEEVNKNLDEEEPKVLKLMLIKEPNPFSQSAISDGDNVRGGLGWKEFLGITIAMLLLTLVVLLLVYRRQTNTKNNEENLDHSNMMNIETKEINEVKLQIPNSREAKDILGVEISGYSGEERYDLDVHRCQSANCPTCRGRGTISFIQIDPASNKAVPKLATENWWHFEDER